MANQGALVSLGHVDAPRLSIFTVALDRVLHLADVETTYAQILDGLPLMHGYRESHWPIPATIAAHESLCDGALDRVRAARAELDLDSFRFDAQAVKRYTDAAVGSVAFALCLIELVAVACHQIAATLYEWNDSIHSREAVLADIHQALDAVEFPWQRRILPQRTYFFNCYYTNFAQYPRGVADAVGYWAETRIFGGVVVFDRGSSDDGNNGVYIHSDRRGFSISLYPPTEAQFKSLIRFLTGPPDADAACPLPVVPTTDNRWRWDHGLAFLHWNIFRDRYERAVSSNYRPNWHKLPPLSWPEVSDDYVFGMRNIPWRGDLRIDDDAVARAEEGLKKITPTSPRWHGPQPDKNEPNPPWRPDYFRDTDDAEQ